jgi:hypothetical protein
MAVIRLGVLGWLVLASCGSGAGAPLRSPSLDYAPPPPSTADGDTVGADRHAPGDKLQEGVSTDGPAPGWDASKNGLKYNPKRRVGGAIEPPPTNGSSAK